MLGLFRLGNLCFDVLAFPAPCHAYSLPHFAQAVRDSSKKITKDESCARRAALGKNRKSGAHHAADGGFSDAREVLGEKSAIDKDNRLVRPVDAQEPAATGFFGLRGRDF